MSGESNLDWVVVGAKGADDKLASDTVILAVGDVVGITDYFAITSGSNPRQVRAITEAIEETIAEGGGPKPRRVEGLSELEWVLLDYGPFVFHVFREETRQYFDLERLWADCERIDWQS